MPWAFLLKYRKDIAYVFAILALVGVFFWYRGYLITKGENRIIEADAKAVAAQKAEDATILKEAQTAHEHELQNLQADAAIHPLPPVRLCIVSPSSLSEKGLSANTSPSGGGVPEVPSGDNSVRTGHEGRDISGMLDLLSQRADRLSADARELQAVAH